MARLPELFGTEHPVALVTGAGAPRVGNVVVLYREHPDPERRKIT